MGFSQEPLHSSSLSRFPLTSSAARFNQYRIFQNLTVARGYEGPMLLFVTGFNSVKIKDPKKAIWSTPIEKGESRNPSCLVLQSGADWPVPIWRPGVPQTLSSSRRLPAESSQAS